jgi:phosphate transport system substrate-binding protein
LKSISSIHDSLHFLFLAITMQKRLTLLSLALLAAFFASASMLTSCGGGKSGSADSAANANANTLTGAGSTFINPIMTHWAAEYQTQDSISVNYQSVGSGAGINNLIDGTVDFAGSDAPMNPDERTRAKAPVIHVPAVVGTECVAYNLPGISSGLKLTGPIVADIYFGKIKYWDDKQITSINPDMKLPHQQIFTAHRSDGSGTTFIFTDYLSKISPDWKTKVGVAKTVTWPEGGIGGKGNEGVAGVLEQHKFSLGYVELAYAEQNHITYASLQNASGNFIAPSVDAGAKAAEGVQLGADLTGSITNTSAPDGYPITGYSWLIVKTNAPKFDQVKKFMTWVTTKGQDDCKALYYAPIPQSVAAAVAAELTPSSAAK